MPLPARLQRWGKRMANLWRALALAWLGGIASPVLTGDAITGEALESTTSLSRDAQNDNSPELIAITLPQEERRADAGTATPEKRGVSRNHTGRPPA
jgi:hypothetical protein